MCDLALRVPRGVLPHLCPTSLLKRFVNRLSLAPLPKAADTKPCSCRGKRHALETEIYWACRMRIWVDAQMSPAIATWISSNYAMSAVAIRDLGLRDAQDKEIFEAARQEKAVVMTKDSDFVLLLDRLGPPPQIIWVTCGNTSNAR